MTDINKQDQKPAEVTRQGMDAGASLPRPGVQTRVEAARLAGEGMHETMRRSTQAAAESQGRLMRDSFQIFEEMNRKLAEMTRGSSDDMRRFFVLPQVPEGGLRDAQQGLTSLVEGMVQTNQRTAQALFRLTNPTAMIELQQRFVRDQMDVLMQSTATLVRAACRTAEEAMRPLEDQVRQRRQEEGYRNAAE
jgi:hypothetical protein